VKFDCKTAEVTMKAGATLASDAAEKALKDAGFGMKEFSGGPPPSIAVARARIRTKKAAPPPAEAIVALAAELPRELSAIGELFVEPDGRFTALVKKDAKLEVDKLAAALARRDLVVEGMEALSWPQSAAGYMVTVRAAAEAGKRDSTRAAIEKIDNVLAAFGDASGQSFVVYTREPCANLEARLRDALRPTGGELLRVGPRGG